MPLQILPRRQAVQGARRPGEKAEDVNHGGDLIACHAVQRLAAVKGLQLGQHLSIIFNGLGEIEQRLGTNFWCGVAPLAKGAIGGLHGGVYLGGRGFGDLQQHLTGCGIINRLLFPFAADQLAIN